MVYIFFFIFLGVIVGYFIRTKGFVNKIGTIINLVIIALLFFLGVAVGSNKQLVENFTYIGRDAFAISLATTLGSIVCAWWVYHKFFKDNKK